MRIGLFRLALAMGMLAVPGFAGLIEVDFAGTWDAIAGENLFPGISAGQAFTGSVFYDPALAPFFTSSTSDRYAIPQSVVINTGGSVITAADLITPATSLVVANPGTDKMIGWVFQNVTATGPAAVGFAQLSFVSLPVNFQGPGNLATLAVPVPFPSLSTWYTNNPPTFYGAELYMSGLSFVQSNLPSAKMAGNITSLSSAPVPEPSTFVLLGVGLAAIPWVRRRAKRIP